MLERFFKKRSTRTADDKLGREFAIGDLIEQRFEVENIRRGAMGVVYIVYDRRRRRHVVLKTFLNKYLFDDDAIARFNTEAEIWMRLGNHPNVVGAFDVLPLLGKPHVVAEYVHGGTLRALTGKMSPTEAIDYSIQICRGMQYAVDQAALMHRDLKPDNILVTLDGQAKVTDFGLSKVLPAWQWSEELRDPRSAPNRMRTTLPNDVLSGTLPYMAPELFEGGSSAGVWTDIYAFGVLLYECLTGRLPFDSPRDESLIKLIRQGTARDPRTLRPNLAPVLAEIVLRCMARRVAERFERFSEVEAALQRARVVIAGAPFTVEWPEDDFEACERLIERGLAHMRLNEYSEALRCFSDGAELERGRAEVWAHLATTRLKLWQYHEALVAVDEGLRRAVSRSEFGLLYTARGAVHTALGQTEKAADAFETGLSYTPNDPNLWNERGLLFRRTGNLRAAEAAFERATKLAPHDTTARRNLADLYFDQERFKRAAALYDEIVQRDPRALTSWERLGATQLRLGHTDEALRAFLMALRIDPEHDEALQGERAARQLLRR